MATFCGAGTAGFTKNSRNSALPSQVARKSVKLPVDRGRIELGRGHHIGKGAGVAGNKGGHLVLPSLAVACRASLTNSAISARSVSGVRTSCLAACSIARSAAKWRSPRRACAAAAVNFLLGGRHDAGALFLDAWP